MEPSRKTALYKLAPGCTFSIRDPSGTAEIVNWTDHGTGTTQPTKEEIQTELDSQNLEWTANEYARNRANEYPSIQNVTVALAEKTEGRSAMWDEITALRLDVKSKYPKT